MGGKSGFLQILKVSDFLNDLKGMLNLDSPKLSLLPIASEIKTDTESDMRNTIDGLKNQVCFS